MSKSMPVMIDTSDATKKLIITSTSTEMSTVINHSLSKISQSTYMDSFTSSIPSIHQSFTTVANLPTNGQDTTTIATTTTTAIITTSKAATLFKNPNNIKVIVPRHQNAASTKNSKSHTNVLHTRLAFAVCILLMLLLVMSSICLIKQRRKSMECDKKLLIGTNDMMVNGSECELNITKRNVYLV